VAEITLLHSNLKAFSVLVSLSVKSSKQFFSYTLIPSISEMEYTSVLLPTPLEPCNKILHERLYSNDSGNNDEEMILYIDEASLPSWSVKTFG